MIITGHLLRSIDYATLMHICVSKSSVTCQNFATIYDTMRN
jgi:hypothetical protein